MSGPGSEGYRNMIEQSAAKRVGTVDEIAGAAALLLGPDGGFITGTDLLIDGGVIAAIRAGRIQLSRYEEHHMEIRHEICQWLPAHLAGPSNQGGLDAFEKLDTTLHPLPAVAADVEL